MNSLSMEELRQPFNPTMQIVCCYGEQKKALSDSRGDKGNGGRNRQRPVSGNDEATRSVMVSFSALIV